MPHPDAQPTVAVCFAGSPERALALVDDLEGRGALSSYAPLYLARADLLRRLGRNDEARECYHHALSLAENEQVRLFIERRLRGA